MMERSETKLSDALSSALYRVFVALARICVRHGVPHDLVSEQLKRAFVRVAHDEFPIPGRKQSASRVALLTGIHRKEIARMRDSESPAGDDAAERIASSASVIAGWRRDNDFADGRGLPAALPFDEGEPNFIDLVRGYVGGDVPARAVLDELERVGAVDRLKDGRIRLLASAYTPTNTSAEGIAILGDDVSDLVATIDHNLAGEEGRPLFQRKVSYDNLPVEAIEGLLVKVDTEGQSVLEKLDRSISRHDRDSNVKAKGTGRKRLMVGVYCYTDDVSED